MDNCATDLDHDDLAMTAADLVAACLPRKTRVHISKGDATASARLIAKLIAATGTTFERGVPVQLKRDRLTGNMRAIPLTVEAVIVAAHRVCQPFEIHKQKNGDLEERDVTLTTGMAKLILFGGEWDLLPLHGVTSAPILDDAGGIRSADGYDDATGMWCDGIPDLPDVPAKPTEKQARAALLTLRQAFRTFPFADAHRIPDAGLGVDVVDLSHPAGADETAAIAGVLTAICRPSLHLTPGWLIRAPAMSGAGSGKGLLARAMSLIAFGSTPQAFTAGHDTAELDKRLVAELIEAAPVLMLDNVNDRALRSDILASVLTERPGRVRVMCTSSMLALNAAAFITITGNGLTVSEDLVRRFIPVELDAGLEDPESRPFKGDFLADIRASRTELLTAALTIWRWGRLHPALPTGAPLGSYGPWCRWVRDPLLALGCCDPVLRVSAAKASDAKRQQIAELFAAWHQHHHDYPVRAADLNPAVVAILDPSGRGSWQFVRSHVEKLVGTRIAGMVLTVSRPAGKHGAATYAVTQTDRQAAQHEVVI